MLTVFRVIRPVILVVDRLFVVAPLPRRLAKVVRLKGALAAKRLRLVMKRLTGLLDPDLLPRNIMVFGIMRWRRRPVTLSLIY